MLLEIFKLPIFPSENTDLIFLYRILLEILLLKASLTLLIRLSGQYQHLYSVSEMFSQVFLDFERGNLLLLLKRSELDLTSR